MAWRGMAWPRVGCRPGRMGLGCSRMEMGLASCRVGMGRMWMGSRPRGDSGRVWLLAMGADPLGLGQGLGLLS